MKVTDYESRDLAEARLKHYQREHEIVQGQADELLAQINEVEEAIDDYDAIQRALDE